MSEISEAEIKAMSKEQNYLRGYSDGKLDVLDKIRAEIEAKCCITVGRENDGAITLHDVFEIFDKYMAEGSDKE